MSAFSNYTGHNLLGHVTRLRPAASPKADHSKAQIFLTALKIEHSLGMLQKLYAEVKGVNCVGDTSTRKKTSLAWMKVFCHQGF